MSQTVIVTRTNPIQHNTMTQYDPLYYYSTCGTDSYIVGLLLPPFTLTKVISIKRHG